jgi:hypothetical protein
MQITDVPPPGADLRTPQSGLLCPFDLHLDPIPQLLNCELTAHPLYDAIEVQTFDDAERGTGMLAFLSRRGDRKVDYYLEPGLRLDPSGYAIGSGIGEWVTDHHFDAAQLDITRDGVVADIRFTDVAGRAIELRVDDRDGRPRRRARLLAPVSAGITQPSSLMVVYLRGFDLVRAVRRAPVIRIDDEDVEIGALPAGRLHRRHLIKYAGPLTTALLNRDHDGPLARVGPDSPGVELCRDGSAVAALSAHRGLHNARVELAPALPDVRSLHDGQLLRGLWRIDVDGDTITGGTWSARRRGDEVSLALDVTRRWRPADRLPLLMRTVTRVIPVFRRWPTTYRWRGTVTLTPEPTMVSGWERTGDAGQDAYRRATAGT